MTSPDGTGRRDRAWWFVCALAAVFLAAHLPFLASTLEDVDSINFALGVRAFDPAAHQPHPPGYPIFIVLGKLGRLVLSEPRALAVWAALCGALAVWPLWRLFQALDAADRPVTGEDRGSAWWNPSVVATVVTVTAPLYWMSAVRPMSDSVGLALALVAQALLATAFVRQSQDTPDARGGYDAAVAARSGRLIVSGAFVAALSVGIRSQALWLTLPLLLLVIVTRVGRGAAGAMLGGVIWFAAGSLVWFVPLVVATGGPSAYLAAFATQAGEDWQWIELLVTRPSLRALALGLQQTFVVHWGVLGWAVVAAATVGGVVTLVRARRAALVLAVAFVPYAVFHLLFQELVTTRYALPLVVPTVYLAVRGIAVLGRLPAAALGLVTAVVALVQVVPVMAAYSAYGSPVAHATADVSTEAARSGAAWLARRHAYARALQAMPPGAGVTVLVPGEGQVLGGEPPPATIVGPGAIEDWLTWRDLPALVTSGRAERLWLFDTPQHLLVSLIDPSAVVVRQAHRWPFDAPTYLGGVRPSDVDWIEIGTPSWVVGEGWHLTPDTAGRAAALKKGLGSGPLTARLRARDGAAVMMMGGRHLGASGDADIRFTARVDDQILDTWTVTAADPFFLRVTELAPGSVAGRGTPWRTLTVEAVDVRTGAPAARAAIDQFDLQDVDRVIVGYGRGWHEQEFNPATGLRWRWASDRADLRLAGPAQDLVLTVRGESPLTSFDAPSTVTLSAGGTTLATMTATSDIAWTVPVPREAVAQSGGVLTIGTSQTFRPADRGENQDRRALGLRIYSVTVTPASSPGTTTSSRTATR